MSDSSKQFALVKDILQKTFAELPLHQNFRVYPIWSQWKQIAGDLVAARSQPDFIQGETLFVTVAHPVWMTELQTHQEILLKKIAALKLPYQVSRIQFRVKREE